MSAPNETAIDENLLYLLREYANKPAKLVEALSVHSPKELVDRLEKPRSSEQSRQIEQDLRWLTQPGHDLVLFHDSDYPPLLRQISDAPFGLWTDGDRGCLSAQPPSVAMVGSRKASHYGRSQALTIATQLAGRGCTVISGLALGIDAAAHEGALQAEGITLAVLGSGCDQIYPRRHWRLADRIREKGLIISEFPPGTMAYPGHFPRRNRIVTGMSQAVIVVEAALRSGSLVSARLALAQGREVMAVPGPVTHPNTRGCHHLIRDGAALVESAEDVLRELGFLEDPLLRCGPDTDALSAEEQSLLDELMANPSSVDGLVELLGQAVDEITVNLVSLEVMGLIHSDGGVYHVTGNAVERTR